MFRLEVTRMEKLMFMLPEEIEILKKDEVIDKLIHFLMSSPFCHDEDVEDVIKRLEMYVRKTLTVSHARKLAFQIHKEAREENDLYKKMIKRACAHCVSTIHVKTHALRAIDYLNKALNTKKGDHHD